MIESKAAEATFRLILWALFHGWTVQKTGLTSWVWRHPGGKEYPSEGKDSMFGTPPLDPDIIRLLREDWRRRGV